MSFYLVGYWRPWIGAALLSLLFLAFGSAALLALLSPRWAQRWLGSEPSEKMRSELFLVAGLMLAFGGSLCVIALIKWLERGPY